jgi:hypothetical protein
MLHCPAALHNVVCRNRGSSNPKEDSEIPRAMGTSLKSNFGSAARCCAAACPAKRSKNNKPGNAGKHGAL